jgi:hypothetical protein
MRVIKALARQSLFDVAIEYCGSITYAWQIARLNALELTYTFCRDTQIIVPQGKVLNIIPVTGIIDNEPVQWIVSGMWIDNNVWIDQALWQDFLEEKI